MRTKCELPIPDFFDPANVERVARVPYGERAAQATKWTELHNIRPATQDSLRVGLLCIDVQNTFCLPDFELFVAGRSGRAALDDSLRLCQFIYRNLQCLTQIVVTMDTHGATQIFHPIFWVNEQGEHPAPYTEISLEEVQRGVWRPNLAIAQSVGCSVEGLEKYGQHYVRTVSSRYPLMIWPYHAMLGGIGHALVSGIEEAIFFHSVARKARASFHTKGNNPLTENYSALRPEVLENYNGQPLGRKDLKLIDEFLSYDLLFVAGQAKSHCVAWTMEDLLAEIRSRDPSLASKIYLLEDCTSPVVAPGADFTDAAHAAFGRFQEAGMHVARSTEAVETWVDLG
ncbi:MAG TPA: isochorismatase [Terriglobia bacterium]|nr:isochorismatase [Terriglobia bacterium]